MKISDKLKQNKYVAYLDVLGFKELVKAKSSKLDKYFNTIQTALRVINQDKPKIEFQLVSDSIILACDLTIDDLSLLLRAVQTIQARCALENIWLRGAITIGDIHFDQTLNIVVGNGLSNAYLMESQEKFPRVIIDPQILKEKFNTRQVFTRTFNNSQFTYNNIPLIHHLNSDKKFIENDAFFVAFAERIAIDKPDNLEIIYKNIQDELYNGQKNYLKYLWLKNYFCEAIYSHLNTFDIFLPVNNNKRKMEIFAFKFETL